MSESSSDAALRAMTDDGSFRVITVRTTETVQGVVTAQRAEGEVARALGEIVTGTILVRETMAPTLRVQGIVQDPRTRSSLVADSWPDGGTRGLFQGPRDEAARRGDTFNSGAVMQMMRSLPNGGVHKGYVQVPASGGFSAALMSYMQESEQVVSLIAVGTLIDRDQVRASGGFIVQLLPELAEGLLAVMTERLDDFPSIESLLREDATPESLMAELLYAMPHTILARSPLTYKCRCDAVRLMTSLSTLPRADILEMIQDGKPLEIQCEYCLHEYTIEPESLRGLITSS